MTKEKCPPDDPRRCQGMTSDGQCEYGAVEGSRFCDWHSMGHAERNLQKQEKRRYVIEREQIKEAYHRHGNDLAYLDLKDEIALTRGLLERRLNLARNESEEIAAQRDLQGWTKSLESMIIALSKMQSQLGLVLGKDQLRRLAKNFATIFNEELEGVDNKEDRIDKINERIFQALEDAGRDQEQDN